MKYNFIFAILIILCSCGKSGSGDGTDGISSAEHRIFVTSTEVNGSFGSIAQANSLCASAASSAGLTLNYKAILSDSSSSVKNRILLLGSVYIFDEFKSKVLITDSGADLWDNNNVTFDNPIDKDEFGSLVSGNVWTGTNDSGNSAGADCSNWSAPGATGRVGLIGALNFGEWLELGSISCTSTARIYCISL